MNLIDFIVDNAFVFIIILGAISSLLGKGKKADKPHAERQKSRPTVTQTLQEYQKKYEETIKQAQKAMGEDSRSKETIEPMLEKAEVEVSSAMDDYLEKQQELRRKSEAMERKINNIKNVAERNLSRPKDLSPFSENSVVNGLIMAEILGPPKSKRGRPRAK